MTMDLKGLPVKLVAVSSVVLLSVWLVVDAKTTEVSFTGEWLIKTIWSPSESTATCDAITERSSSSNYSTGMLEFPVWQKNGFPPSGVRKHLTRELFDLLKTRRTSRGTTLWQLIRSSVINRDTRIGLYLGDEESLDVFAELIEPVVQDCHWPHKLSSLHKLDFDPTHLAHIEDPDPEGKFIISTRIRVSRNLKGYGLTPTLSQQERLDVEKRVIAVLEQLTGELSGRYYPLGALDEPTRQRMVDDHFLFKNGDPYFEGAGISRDWPEGRGIFHNEAKTFLVWLNEEDQLRIISMQKGSDIRQVFERLARAVEELSSRLNFQFNPHYGYLSACPTNLGTGLRASVHIRIPNAAKHPNYELVLLQHQLDIRGIDGERTESVDGIYDVSNRRRLGLSEVQCVRDMYKGVRRLIEMEQEATAKLHTEL